MNYPYYKPMPQQSSLDWIFVQNVDQVDAVCVNPNCKAWIMVQNEPVFALRTADAMGLTKTEFYRFEKYDPHPKAEYVTKDELMAMLNELRGDSNESIIPEATDKPTNG